jgi:glucose-1-phosphate cytidylyltransferase
MRIDSKSDATMTESLPVVILVGGAGTRLGRGGETPPKALVEVGDRPIVWHVMKIYAAFGCTHFVLTLGYRGDLIRRYFLDYDVMGRDVTVSPGDAGSVQFHGPPQEAHWRVTLVDTGLGTNKAARVRRAAPYLGTGTFFVTYGDGVGDVNIAELLAFHRRHGKRATVTCVQPFSQYGVVAARDDGRVTALREKPRLDHWINAGFMVFEHSALDYLQGGDDLDLEKEVLPRLAAEGQLMMYRHPGFWQSMDTFKDAQALSEVWEKQAPWKVW